MKISFKNVIRSFSILSLVFLAACQDSEKPKKKQISKEDIESEYTAEMSKKGNEEISIADMEKNMDKNDEELEELMEEMEREMEVDE